MRFLLRPARNVKPAARATGPKGSDESVARALACFYIPRAELLNGAVEDQRRDWRAECDQLADAFARWSDARGNRASAFAAYLEALDGEQHAADIYRDLLAEQRRHSP